VLHLLLEGASHRDIASRLVLRVDTVQRPGYTRCGKLGVKRRPQAIARARALDLALSPCLASQKITRPLQLWWVVTPPSHRLHWLQTVILPWPQGRGLDAARHGRVATF
jgi:hypothetical protein